MLGVCSQERGRWAALSPCSAGRGRKPTAGADRRQENRCASWRRAHARWARVSPRVLCRYRPLGDGTQAHLHTQSLRKQSRPQLLSRRAGAPQLSVQMLIKSHQVSRPGHAMVHLGSPWSVAPCVRQLSLCEALTFLPGNGQGVRAPTRRVPGDPAAAEGLRTCPTAAHDSHSHECRDRDASGDA